MIYYTLLDPRLLGCDALAIALCISSVIAGAYNYNTVLYNAVLYTVCLQVSFHRQSNEPGGQ